MLSIISANVHGLLLCWNFKIVSLATAVSRNPNYKYILLFRSIMSAGITSDKRAKADAVLGLPA